MRRRSSPPWDLRRPLRGFVYAPIRAGDLFAGIFGSEAEPRGAFRAFDGPDTSAAALLFDSRTLGGDGVPAASEPIAFARLDSLVVAGRRWTLAFAPLTVASDGSAIPATALWIALFGTFLATTVDWSRLASAGG